MSNNEIVPLSRKEQLRLELEQLEREERQEQQAKRQAYEGIKEDTVQLLFQRASAMSTILKDFSELAKSELTTLKEMMREYGDLRANSKGGFSIKSQDGTLKVEYNYNEISEFDERAALAEEHLKLFLESFIKPKDIQIYQMVLSLLERNKQGKFELPRVQKLYSMENQFDDENWKKGIELLKESYQSIGSRYYINFYRKQGTGWTLIPLNFSSL